MNVTSRCNLWATFGLSVALGMMGGVESVAGAEVGVERLELGRVQPQVVMAEDGGLHMICLSGDPKAADVEYRWRKDGGGWSEPMRVNSQAGSAIAVGTIRGAQMALGREGVVHVVWNGSSVAEPKPPLGGGPMCYARLAKKEKQFSPQRNVMQQSHELDGGGSVAADGLGNVMVVWQASPEGLHGETNRAVFAVVSEDGGIQFGRERVVSPAGVGACGCCGLAAWWGGDGTWNVLFRSAAKMSERGMKWLAGDTRDWVGGKRFQLKREDAWAVSMCPMSSAGFGKVGGGVGEGMTWGVWERAGKIYVSRGVGGEIWTVGPEKGAKHPRVVGNGGGEALVVWVEGTGWGRGGVVAWQRMGERGEMKGGVERREGVPVWSFAAPYVKKDGSFVVVY